MHCPSRLLCWQKNNNFRKIDKLIFTNAGNFYDGSAEDYVLERKNIASKYRNKALVDAMKELGMIDKLGTGVKTMYETQRKKYFPFPTYDYDKRFDETKLEIYGKEIDKKFTEILMNKGDLDFNTTIILDKIQKNKIDEIDKRDLNKLREKRLIEKIGKEYILSSKVAEILGKEAEYTEKKGFTDDEISMFIIKHLKNFGDGIPRKKINEYVWKFLPGVLSEEQKYKKVQRILTKLKEDGSIEKINGKTKDSMWILKRE